MTNHKMSLGSKIAITVALAGIAGMAGGTVRSIAELNRTYPTLNKEASIIYQIDHLNDNTLFDENVTSLEYYSTFKNDYAKNLENSLQSVRASPQYISEQQKKEEDKKRSDNAANFALLSSILFIGGFLYCSKGERTRTPSKKYQTTSGGY